MTRPTVIETTCKSMINRVQGMPFRWSVNPYRGCSHDCRYCYAIVTHEFVNLEVRDFARVIQVKMNAAEVLRHELARPGWKREKVAFGTATDCYQPVEGRYRITRQCLAAFAEARSPVSLVTKGTMVVRDLDVLQALSQVADVTVCITITTVDRDLWMKLEPGTPPPAQRLRALKMLTEAGIHAGILMAPVIPGLTTNRRHVQALVGLAAQHGARFVGAGVLHLRPGVREPFLRFLESEYPALTAGYRRLYAGKYANETYRDQVLAVVEEEKARYGVVDGRARPDPPPPAQQLTFWSQ